MGQVRRLAGFGLQPVADLGGQGGAGRAGMPPCLVYSSDTRANAHLQEWSAKDAAIFHFLKFRRPHVLDLIMQGLFTKTQSSPLEAPYFSCVPYLMGEGQAMEYSFWPVSKEKTPIPRLPLRPPDDYLRNAMVAALAKGDVDLDVRVQLQTCLLYTSRCV